MTVSNKHLAPISSPSAIDQVSVTRNGNPSTSDSAVHVAPVPTGSSSNQLVDIVDVSDVISNEAHNEVMSSPNELHADVSNADITSDSSDIENVDFVRRSSRHVKQTQFYGV